MTGEHRFHLCLTHSPLVTLVFGAAMKKAGVPSGQVGYLSRRSSGPAGSSLSSDDLSDSLESCYKRFERADYRRLRARLTARVDEVTQGERFLAYIPHTRRLLYQEILAHPGCDGYLFIEEGFTSMAWKSHQIIKLSAARRLRHALRRWWVRSEFDAVRAMFDIADRKFRGAVSISSHAFTGMPDVVNVSEWIPHYTRQGGGGKLYVVLDTCYLHRGILWRNYEDALTAAISEAMRDAAEILVKFHFADDGAAVRFASLKDRLGCRMPMALLDRNFSIEDYLTADDRLLFGVSSLGYYAALFGAAVECFAPKIEDLDLDRWISKGLLPPDFREVAGLAKTD